MYDVWLLQYRTWDIDKGHRNVETEWYSTEDNAMRRIKDLESIGFIEAPRKVDITRAGEDMYRLPVLTRINETKEAILATLRVWSR